MGLSLATNEVHEERKGRKTYYVLLFEAWASGEPDVFLQAWRQVLYHGPARNVEVCQAGDVYVSLTKQIDKQTKHKLISRKNIKKKNKTRSYRWSAVIRQHTRILATCVYVCTNKRQPTRVTSYKTSSVCDLQKRA